VLEGPDFGFINIEVLAMLTHFCAPCVAHYQPTAWKTITIIYLSLGTWMNCSQMSEKYWTICPAASKGMLPS
jgi:hypothetical protein